MDLRDAYFQEDSFRFATLLLASLVSLISSSINFTFPSIAPTLEFSFNTNSYDLYILTISYSIIYLFFSIPASFFIEKYGIRISLLICMILQSVGIILKFFFYIKTLKLQFLFKICNYKCFYFFLIFLLITSYYVFLFLFDFCLGL